jgi:hypothetical protein
MVRSGRGSGLQSCSRWRMEGMRRTEAAVRPECCSASWYVGYAVITLPFHLTSPPSSPPGESFVNCDPRNDIQAVLSTQQGSTRAPSPRPPVDCSTEMICTWAAAAKEGDVDALTHIFGLQSTISGALSNMCRFSWLALCFSLSCADNPRDSSPSLRCRRTRRPPRSSCLIQIAKLQTLPFLPWSLSLRPPNSGLNFRLSLMLSRLSLSKTKPVICL